MEVDSPVPILPLDLRPHFRIRKCAVQVFKKGSSVGIYGLTHVSDFLSVVEELPMLRRFGLVRLIRGEAIGDPEDSIELLRHPLPVSNRLGVSLRVSVKAEKA